MKITFEKSAKSRKKKEFSKVVLAAVVILYVLAACYGGYIVFYNHELLGELLAFIGAPTAVAIGYYEWKAKNENVVKIKKQGENDNGND